MATYDVWKQLGSPGKPGAWTTEDALHCHELFRLITETNGEKTALGSAGFHIIGGTAISNGYAFQFSSDSTGGDGHIRVVLTISSVGGELICGISVQAAGEVSVNQVQFPIVEENEVHAFDGLLMSAPWGDNIRKPVETIRQYCAGKGSSWIYDYVKCGEDEVIYAYPSILAMQYMVLHNPSRALYVASYGEGDSTMAFRAKAVGNNGLKLAVDHYPFLRDGEWESQQCSIALQPGGWHAAADLYASHMRSRFPPPKNPVWMREDTTGWNGFVQVFLRMEGQQLIFRYRDLPDVYRRVRAAGMETLHVAGWNYNGFDTRYPDYDTDPELGSAEELTAAIREIHTMGGRVILYTNGRLVDPDSLFCRSGGDRCLCLDENGQPYVERYNTSVAFRIACPACPEYGEYLAGQVKKIAGAYGADAVQIDQISCNYAYFCHDSTHPHATPATNYLPGVCAELQAVRHAHSGVNPDFFTWCEGCHERFGQHYDVNQGHGESHSWQLGESIPEQFLYTYPDRWVTGSSSSIQQLCHTFAQGKPFDLPLASLDNSEYMRVLQSFIQLRRAYPRFFYRGVFLDCAGIEVSEGTRVFSIAGRGGGLLVNLWKPGAGKDSQCAAWLRIPRENGTCKAVYPPSANVSEAAGMIQVSWSGPVATLLLGHTANG